MTVGTVPAYLIVQAPLQSVALALPPLHLRLIVASRDLLQQRRVLGLEPLDLNHDHHLVCRQQEAITHTLLWRCEE